MVQGARCGESLVTQSVCAGGPAGDSLGPRLATSGRLRNIMEDETANKRFRT
jgi:hypothetical protein